MVKVSFVFCVWISLRSIIDYAINEIEIFSFVLLVSFMRANDETYYYTNMLREAFVTSQTDDDNSFNNIAQSNGEDFWKVGVWLVFV